MKKRALRIFSTALVLLLAFTLCGCNSAQTDAPGEQVAPSPSATVSGTSPTPADSEMSEPSVALVTESSGEPAECSWTLEVSDTETAQVNGYDFTCTLSIMAIKLGGLDELGTYRGIVTLDYKYDMEKGNISGNASGGGQEIDAVIEVVGYDDDKYMKAAGKEDLASLIKYDAMALGNFNLTGSGEANEQAGAGSWNTSGAKTLPVPFRMAVDGGQVTIELYTVAPNVNFKGMITGTPV